MILEYIEQQLLITHPLSQNNVNHIKSEIKRILSEFANDQFSAEYLTFRVQLFCKEIGIKFNKLFTFNKHEIAEKGAEWQWRSKWNRYKDASLFNRFISSRQLFDFL